MSRSDFYRDSPNAFSLQEREISVVTWYRKIQFVPRTSMEMDSTRSWWGSENTLQVRAGYRVGSTVGGQTETSYSRDLLHRVSLPLTKARFSLPILSGL